MFHVLMTASDLNNVLMGFNGPFLVLSVTIWSTQCVLYIFCKMGSHFLHLSKKSQFCQISYHLH